MLMGFSRGIEGWMCYFINSKNFQRYVEHGSLCVCVF